MSRLLLIDIGNSRIKWAIKHDTEFTPAAARLHRGHKLVDLLEMDFGHLAPPDRIFVSCVASSALRDSLNQWVEEHWQLRPHYLSSSPYEAGVTNAYSQPHTLGSDRWASMIAAYQRAAGAVCVVDAGTALTIDVLRHDGQHLGGLILPGFYALQSTLFMQTTLPAVTFEPISMHRMLGMSTQECIGLGAQHALAALTVRLFSHLKQDLGGAPPCYLTGGDALVLAAILPVPTQHFPHLVLEGLAVLATTP